MKRISSIIVLTLLLCSIFFLNFTPKKGEFYEGKPLFITDIEVQSQYGLFLSQKGTKSVVCYNNDLTKIEKSWTFDEIPTGIAVNEEKLYVTTFETVGKVHIINLKNNAVEKVITIGSGATSPTLSADNRFLFVCNQFQNTVSRIDCQTQTIAGEVKVLREPRALALSKNGKYLFVANYLPAQQANVDTVAACVSVVTLSDFKKIKDIQLANGSNAVQSLCLINNDEYLLVVHNLGRFQVPTSQLQQGWMNTSAMSVVNVENLTCEGAVLLDEPERGAGGVWGIACNEKNIIVTQFGTHEVSIIDHAAFIEKYKSYPDKTTLSYDLRFLYGIRDRIKLQGNGPREIELVGDKVIIPTYFSDTLNTLDLNSKTVDAVGLVKNRVETDEQKGEKYFNDATYCFQNWQSCSGCHPGEARTDAMNWDLMNDGMGNSKNCKSMLYSHATPPSMISGIRAKAEIAVRKGFNLIQFADIPEPKAICVDKYLISLKPVPSPYLVNGQLSAKAMAGREVYEKMECQKCHSGPYFTDLKMYRIGDNIEFEKGWDTPTLVEVWRTAPYLFDGRAATMRDVFVKHKHGIEKKISPKEVDELVEYVNSL